jgi:foldase protein PrsA
MKKSAALGAFFIAVALIVAGCGSSGVPSNAVASVAGNPISMKAYDHWMFVAEMGNAEEDPGAPVIVPTDPPNFAGCIKQVRKQIPSLAKTSDKEIKSDCSQLFTSLSGQVMDFLIKAYWYQADAHKDGIKLTAKQLATAFTQAKKQQFTSTAEYTAFLKSTGQTQADIIYRVRVNKIYSELLTKQEQKVTTAAISSYYSSHKSQFGTKESRNLLIVRTNSDSQIKLAEAALKSGQSWAAVAKKYSVDASTKNNGGVLNGVTNGEEEAALNTVAFSAPLNKLEGPVKGTFGYYLVKVTKIKAGTQQTLTKATSLIKQLLTSKYQTAAENKVNATSKKNWGSQTLCSPLFSMADCHGYKKPKTSTSTTAAGSTVTSSAGSAAGSTVTTSTGTAGSTVTSTAGTVTVPTTTTGG